MVAFSSGSGHPTNRPSSLEDRWPVLRLKDRAGEDSAGFRVLLAIDGGGLRGLLPAMVLEILEEEIREVICDLFSRSNVLFARGDNGSLQDKLKGSPLLAKDLQVCSHESPHRPQPSVTDSAIANIVTEKKFHVHIADFFDCVTGTSTGSILAAHIASAGCGLCKDMLHDSDFAKMYKRSTVRKNEDDIDAAFVNPAAERSLDCTPRPDSAAAATDTYLAKADVIFQEQPWWDLMASVPAAIAWLPGMPALKGLLRPLHPSDGLQSTLQKAFATPGSTAGRQTSKRTWPWSSCNLKPSAGHGELTLADDLKTSLVIPAFEMKSDWQISTGQPGVRDTMHRGNRPVAFCFDRVRYLRELRLGQQATTQTAVPANVASCGLLRTNRLFYYTKDGLSEAAAGLVMPGYEPSEEAAARQNLEGHTPHMAFQPHLKYTPGCNFKLSEAVQASCSAPTFFPAAYVKQVSDAFIPEFGGNATYTGSLVDGGVAANNPTLLGLGFMQKQKRNKVGRIAVLSLGTGLYTSSAESNTKNSGKAQWAQKLFGILMSAGTELNEAIVDELYYNQQNDLKMSDSNDPDMYLPQFQYTRINYAAEDQLDVGTTTVWDKCQNMLKRLKHLWGPKSLSYHRAAEVLQTMDKPSAAAHLQRIGNMMARSHQKHLRAFVMDFCMTKWSGGGAMQQLLVEKQQALAGQQPQLQLQPQPQPQPQQPELEELALTDPYVLQSPKANIPASGSLQDVAGSGPPTPEKPLTHRHSYD